MLHVQLTEIIALHSQGEDEPTEMNLEPQALVDWTEGIEHLQTKSTDQLYEMLGFKDAKIPFLVEEIDVEPDVAAEDDAEGAAPPQQVVQKQPFALRWYQLVGVVKMVECALTSRPLLIMDDVGLGKTIQVLAFFAVMAYYRKYHSEVKRYPGIWGMHTCIAMSAHTLS